MDLDLRSLTIKEHRKLEEEGKIKQVSGPGIIVLDASSYLRDAHTDMPREKQKKRAYGANAYMLGGHKELERCTVISYIFYKISK